MTTDHYGLGAPGGSDTETIDRLLFRGAEQHRHSGGGRPTVDPMGVLALGLRTGGGLVPGGTEVRYRYTLVDSGGFESAPSPLMAISTPPPSSAPLAPVLVPGEGSLPGGNHLYVVSAYRSTSSQETPTSLPARFMVPFERRTGVVVEMPALPEGMDGFNVYRRGPGEVMYSLVQTLAGPGQTWADDGSVTPNKARTPQATDKSNLANSVEVTLLEEPPAGYNWALYRTYTADWSRSLVSLLPASQRIYVDSGEATRESGPPPASQLPGNPPKVQLTDGAETEGLLPMGQATYPLTVRLGDGDLWVCEAPTAQLLGCRLVSVVPAQVPGSAQLLDATDALVAAPSLETGQRVGTRVPPDVPVVLSEGQWLRASGGELSLHLVLYGFDSAKSFAPPAG